MKLAMFLGIFVLLSGCVNSGGGLYDTKISPKDFKCPSQYIAFCEGRTPATMECTCVNRKYERQIMQAIGLN